ncbi:hypothetical protein Q5762_07485 [Streptomyces sp. P9(2023)]|uniref:phage tail protein n=1 Tax=Streptomyces sp. P9(2023) TaxID=3064394 RepID=UPI0028F42501|nr:hypothetical protein [Streptomyces sp. P9(2023)]MDT9688199.1 hypothetical protein [Streptomyces sp. P9(2023)]
MAGLTVGELTALIDADDSGMRRGLSDADLRMRGFQRDVEGRLRRLDGRFVSTGELIAAGLRTGTDEGRRFGLSLGGLGGMVGKLGGLATSIGGIAAKLGAAVPLAAGLASAVGSIAPAAGLAASGLFAVQLATKTLQLGMVGVGDAVSAALDPSKAEEFNEALKKLSPSARAFALQVKALAPEFREIQQMVQERMFKGLDKILKEMGKTTLPILKNGLRVTAGTLNLVAKNIGNVAIGLSRSGALGQAISGANRGLNNLAHVPGVLVQGLTQVAAAAGPSFAKLTAAAGGAFEQLSTRMADAFADGRMQAAIERAVSLLGDLAEIAGNVVYIIGSVFSAAQVSGGGLIGMLKELTGQIADAFASPEALGGLKAIFGVMAQIGKSVGPILVSLLKTLGRVFEVLGPPVEELVRHLGAGLLKIADALGPVLVELAKVVGLIVEAALPFVDLAADLVASILPALVPLFASFGEVVKAAAPFLAQLAQTAGAVLLPILNTLATQVLPKLLPPFVDMANRIFPLLTEVLVGLTPSLTDLALAFADLLVEAAPLVVKIIEMGTALLEDLMPYIGPIIALMTKLTAGALTALADFITRYVIPAVKALGALLSGDFSGALEHVKTLGRNLATDFANSITRMRDRSSQALSQLRDWASRRATEMATNLGRSVSKAANDTINWFRGIPGRIRKSFSDQGNLLYGAGRRILQGLINGVKSMISSLRAEFSGITNMIPDWKGPADVDARLLRPAGRLVIGGFQRGISDQVPALQRQLQGITTSLPGMTMGGPTGGGYAGAGGPQRVVIELSGPREMRELIRGIVQRDGRGDVQLAFGQY